MEHRTENNLIYTEPLTKKDLAEYLFTKGIRKAATKKKLALMESLSYWNDSITLEDTAYIICRSEKYKKRFYVMYKPGVIIF